MYLHKLAWNPSCLQDISIRIGIKDVTHDTAMASKHIRNSVRPWMFQTWSHATLQKLLDFSMDQRWCSCFLPWMLQHDMCTKLSRGVLEWEMHLTSVQPGLRIDAWIWRYLQHNESQNGPGWQENAGSWTDNTVTLAESMLEFRLECGWNNMWMNARQGCTHMWFDILEINQATSTPVKPGLNIHKSNERQVKPFPGDRGWHQICRHWGEDHSDTLYRCFSLSKVWILHKWIVKPTFQGASQTI